MCGLVTAHPKLSKDPPRLGGRPDIASIPVGDPFIAGSERSLCPPTGALRRCRPALREIMSSGTAHPAIPISCALASGVGFPGFAPGSPSPMRGVLDHRVSRTHRSCLGLRVSISRGRLLDDQPVAATALMPAPRCSVVDTLGVRVSVPLLMRRLDLPSTGCHHRYGKERLFPSVRSGDGATQARAFRVTPPDGRTRKPRTSRCRGSCFGRNKSKRVQDST